MRILTCIKQVPDSEAPITVDASGTWFASPRPAWRMNRYDEFAVEEALIIKEQGAETVVDALSVGPPRVQAAIRRALEMGADTGIHIAVPAEGYIEPSAIASLIAAFARDRHYDLILCGVMSEDGMHAQVGPLIAEQLDIPCVTSVIARRPGPDKGALDVEQEIEGGVRQHFTVALPALLSVQSGINHPRYPTLTHVLRAKRQAITTIPGQLPDARPSAVRPPDQAPRGRLLRGSLRDQACAMLRILQEHALL